MAGPFDPQIPTGLPPVIPGNQPTGFLGQLGQNLTSPGFLQALSTMLMSRAYGPNYGNFLQGANQGQQQRIEQQRIQQEMDRQRIQMEQNEQYRRDMIRLQEQSQKRLEESAKAQQEAKLAADEEKRMKAFQDFTRLHMNAGKIDPANADATIQTMGEQYKIPQEAIDAQKAAIAAAFKQREEENSWWVNTETGVPEKFKARVGPSPTEGYRYRGPYTKEEAETVSTKIMAFKKASEEKKPGLGEQREADLLAAYASKVGKSVEELTPAERDKARFERDAALAAARMSEAPGQELPLFNQMGQVVGFVDRQTGKVRYLPKPTEGIGSSPNAMLQQLYQFGKAEPVIDGIAELSERINTQQGVVAKISGEIERKKAIVNLNDDISEYEALVSGFTPIVARAVGHTGVLTENDEMRVRNIFPKPTESKTVRDRKTKRLKQIVGGVTGAIKTPISELTAPGAQTTEPTTKVVNGTTYEKGADGLWHKKTK